MEEKKRSVVNGRLGPKASWCPPWGDPHPAATPHDCFEPKVAVAADRMYLAFQEPGGNGTRIEPVMPRRATRCWLADANSSTAFERPNANCYNSSAVRSEVCLMLWGIEALPKLALICRLRRSLPPKNHLYRMVCKEELSPIRNCLEPPLAVLSQSSSAISSATSCSFNSADRFCSRTKRKAQNSSRYCSRWNRSPSCLPMDRSTWPSPP